MADWGVDAESISSVRHAEEVDTRFVLDADHYSLVQWFIEHVNGIWRTDFNGNRSLDYGQIYHAFQIENISSEVSADFFEKLRHIERGYL